MMVQGIYFCLRKVSQSKYLIIKDDISLIYQLVDKYNLMYHKYLQFLHKSVCKDRLSIAILIGVSRKKSTNHKN